MPPAPYFLFALPDHFYFWINRSDDWDALPDLEISAVEALAPYVVGLEYQLHELSSASLEMIVRFWLHDLARGAGRRHLSESAEQSLDAVGFFDAMRGARIVLERNVA